MNKKCFAAACLALAIAACGSDDTGDGTSSGGSSSGSTTSSGSTSSSGGTSSSTSSSSTSSTSSTSSSGSPAGSKELGADCEENAECKERKCVRFTDNAGAERGFCSRVCTKVEDCPEDGWECNLSPYTACVPAKN